MADKKISIVIPAHNASKTISKTLRALTLEEEGNEITIVDDGSTDNIKDIVSKFSGVKYIYQQNQGPAAARNNGWWSSSGDIICFTDSDCIPEKGWALALANQFDSDKIAAVGGSYEIANQDNLLASCIHKEILERHLKMPREVKALGSYNLAVRRKVLEEIGGFDQSYSMASGEDNDLSYRIRKKGLTLIFNKDIKVAHFYPDNLYKYLVHQFWHGFWRMKLYRDHPQMMGGDDYSSFWDYLQPLLSWLILCLIPFLLILPFRILFLVLLSIEIILQMPLAFSVIVKSKELKYFMLAFVTLLRGFARGWGMFWGMMNFVLIKNR